MGKRGFKKGEFHHTLEARKKIREHNAMKRPEIADEVRNKNRGKKASEETREKLRKVQGGVSNPRYKDGKYMALYKLRKQLGEGREKADQCELCGAIGVICLDHDHATNKFRGWLCRRCNLTLGLVKDSKELLNKMVEYLN